MDGQQNTPEKAKITPYDALTYGSEEHAIALGLNENSQLRQGAEKAREIQQIRATEGSTGIAAIEAARPQQEVHLSKTHFDELELRFGAGKMMRDRRGKLALSDEAKTYPQEVQAAINANSEDGRRVVNQARDFLTYTEIYQEHLQTGVDLEDIQKTKNINSTADYDAMRVRALDVLAQSPMVHQLLPEIISLQNPDARRDLLENYLAKDPVLRNKIAKQFRGFHERARSELVSIVSDQEYLQAKEMKKEAGEGVEEGVKSAISKLTAENINIPDKVSLQKRLQEKINAGMSAKAATETLKREIIAADEVFQLLLARRSAEESYERARKQFEKTINDMKLQKGEKREDHPMYSQSQKDEEVKNQADEYRTQLEKTLQSVTGRQQKENELNKLLSDELLNSEVLNALQSSVNAQEKIKQAESTIRKRETEALKKDQESINDRLLKESELIKDMEKMMSNALAERLTERITDMAQFEEKRLEKAIAAASSDAEKKVLTSMQKKWIEYKKDKRERVVHKDAIKNDMMTLVYKGEGDEGVKRLILRDLGLKKADGTDVDWQTVDLEEGLTKEQKNQMNEMHGKLGDKYKEQLLKSFAQEKGVVKLKDHEWALLDRYYGTFLNDELAKRPDVVAIKNKLREQGINVDQDSKMKLLLYILSALGLVVGGAIVLGGAPVIGLATMGAGTASSIGGKFVGKNTS